jgi:hypothetical protein
MIADLGSPPVVIPAKAGIQESRAPTVPVILDARFRGHDEDKEGLDVPPVRADTLKDPACPIS